MHPIRSDLQTLARACERLLAHVEEPALSEDEKNFVLYYASELINTFGKNMTGNGHKVHQATFDDRQGKDSTQTGQSA